MISDVLFEVNLQLKEAKDHYLEDYDKKDWEEFDSIVDVIDRMQKRLDTPPDIAD